MTGLTQRQATLLELAGMLEMVEWKVAAARSSFFPIATPEDKAAEEYLAKVVLGLKKLRTWTAENGWRQAEATKRTASASMALFRKKTIEDDEMSKGEAEHRDRG